MPGSVDGCDDCAVFHFEQPFPFCDGTDTTLMREDGCYVGILLPVTLQIMADGTVDEDGIFITEMSSLDADCYFEEIEDRGFDLIAEQVPEQTILAKNQD